MRDPIWIGIEIKSYDCLSISKSRKAILAIDRYIKKRKNSKGSAFLTPALPSHCKGRNSCYNGAQRGNNLCEEGADCVPGNQTIPQSLPFRESFVSLPIKRKRYTVLRSPHIDKKSREHFEWKQNKVKVFLAFERSEEWGLFLFILGNAKLPGVQLLISCQYSTFCSF